MAREKDVSNAITARKIISSNVSEATGRMSISVLVSRCYICLKLSI